MYPIKTFCLGLFFTLMLFKGMTQDTAYWSNPLDFYPKVYWVNQLFKGNVKEAIATNYKYENDSLKDDGFTKWKFNEYGQMTSFSWQFIHLGKVHGDSTTYQFNDEHLLEEVRWYNDVTDELYTATHYTYSKNYQLKYIHVYNKNGKLTDSTVFNYKKDTLYPVEILKYGWHTWREGDKSKDSIELRARHLYKYDGHNNLLFSYKYDEQGELQMTLDWLYDKNNHCINEGIQTGNLPKVVWLYNVNQMGYILTSYEIYKGHRNLHKINRYDSSKLIYQSICAGDVLHSDEDWKYDSLGNPVYNKIQRADAPTKVTTTTYEYDKNGNFTKRHVWVNNVPETLDYRVITYY